MKKNLLVAISLLTIVSLSSCGEGASISAKTNSSSAASSSSLPASSSLSLSVQSKTVDLYRSPTNKKSIALSFINEVNDIPFLEMGELAAQLTDFSKDDYGPDFSLTLSALDGVYTLRRENDSAVIFDFKAQTLTYHDYAAFFNLIYAETSVDPFLLSGFDSEGRASLLERNPAHSSERLGRQDVVVKLGEEGVPMYRVGEKAYLPFQTFSDFLIGPCLMYYAYNGEAVFAASDTIAAAGFSDLYYARPTGERSRALADFTYKEFCANFDTFYGLKDVRGIASFDAFATQIGLKADLTSLEAKSAEAALAKLAYSYLSDGHTKYLSNSPYLGKDVTIKKEDYWSAEYQDFENRYAEIEATRTAAYKDLPFFEIVGDTAIFTFDVFTLGLGESYYASTPTDQATDSLGQMLYAHAQILAAGDKVKNVVMDLSCNTGGQGDMAVLAAAWFLGESVIPLENTLTGAQGMNAFRVDANLDRQFNEDDTLGNRHLYCLTSRVSFSCGNLLPCLFKNSGKVSLIGQKSGGGTCFVAPLSLADGTIFRISGPLRLDYVKNGTFYNIDQGADPDYPIGDLSFLYQNKRADLVSYIDSLH
jgi:hypothetical protein